MKLFKCENCGQLLHFENRYCENCGRRVGYLSEKTTLSVVESDGEGWRAAADPGLRYKFCANAEHDVCNWLLPEDPDQAFCAACRHNKTIPDISLEENLARWRRIERAKHRLIYSLLRLRLPLATRMEDPEHGLAFDFLAEPPAAGMHVTTGHDSGLITLALSEADDAERERTRQQMGEGYRTLLGHFRHEIGHHYWDLLVRDGNALDGFRVIFGDERADYAEALRRHYETGPPADWQQNFVSRYASSHPWEDFAETWAHYMHIVDTLETARAVGISVRPRLDTNQDLATNVDFDAYRTISCERMIDSWIPLTIAMNSLNRAMGQPDVYPFILSPAVLDKLSFVHDAIRDAGKSSDAGLSGGSAAA